jgi:sugar-specific transcriptional regulator TrmB
MSQNDNEYIQALMKLGLTFLQAKIYTTIVKLGTPEVRKISVTSTVARPDVYRIIPTLEQIGIVEKIISTPNTYKAIPITEALSILLQKKIDEDAELQKKTMTLITNFHEKTDAVPEEEGSQFVITSERKLFLKKFTESVNSAKSTEDFIGKADAFPKTLMCQAENFKAIMEKGVKIRFITEDTTKLESILDIIRELQKNPLFELKVTSGDSLVCMLIMDNKEVNIQMSCGAVPSLWSNNPLLVKIVANYFKTLWDKAVYLNAIDA